MKYYIAKKAKDAPIICHIPHGSIAIPGKFRQDFMLSDKDLKIEAKTMGDLFADQLYDRIFKRFGGLKSNISRIVVDMERCENDRQEPMSKVGMGVLYSKTSAGKMMRRVSEQRREQYLEGFFRPYQEALAALVDDCLGKFGVCLILDCHSFPSKPRKYEPDQKKNRPDICFGTDKKHTPPVLKKIFVREAKKRKFSIKFNSPFRGTIVPLPMHGNKQVFSILIETNRRLYMDEKNFKKKRDFKNISGIIEKMVYEASVSFLKKLI